MLGASITTATNTYSTVRSGLKNRLFESADLIFRRLSATSQTFMKHGLRQSLSRMGPLMH